nr:hypothetical protein [Tanacetum cinerariifolium]
MLQGIPTASYNDPTSSALCHCKGPASESFTKKKGRTVVITTEDIHKRRNDVKARITLLLALPDEHQLRFSKYKTAKELWEAILKNFGENEATKKTKKNQLKQQYGNFKAEVIEFGDSYKAHPEETGKGPASESFTKKKGRTVVITTEDIQKRRNDVKARITLLLALPDEHQDDLDTMSLDDVYNYLKVYEPEVQKKSKSNSQNLAFISLSNTTTGKSKLSTASVPTAGTQVSTASTDVATASLSHDTVCAYIATQSNGSQIKYEDITQIDKDDIEEIDIK